MTSIRALGSEFVEFRFRDPPYPMQRSVGYFFVRAKSSACAIRVQKRCG